MANLTEYWDRVAKILESLYEGDVHITSLDNPEKTITAGRVFFCSRQLAAERLAVMTHRLSTKPEIKAFDDKIAADQKQAEVEAMKRKLIRMCIHRIIKMDAGRRGAGCSRKVGHLEVKRLPRKGANV